MTLFIAGSFRPVGLTGTAGSRRVADGQRPMRRPGAGRRRHDGVDPALGHPPRPLRLPLLYRLRRMPIFFAQKRPARRRFTHAR